MFLSRLFSREPRSGLFITEEWKTGGLFRRTRWQVADRQLLINGRHHRTNVMWSKRLIRMALDDIYSRNPHLKTFQVAYMAISYDVATCLFERREWSSGQLESATTIGEGEPFQYHLVTLTTYVMDTGGAPDIRIYFKKPVNNGVLWVG